MFIYVQNCDETHKKALAAGATTVMEPSDHSYGPAPRACAMRLEILRGYGGEVSKCTHLTSKVLETLEVFCSSQCDETIISFFFLSRSF